VAKLNFFRVSIPLAKKPPQQKLFFFFFFFFHFIPFFKTREMLFLQSAVRSSNGSSSGVGAVSLAERRSLSSSSSSSSSSRQTNGRGIATTRRKKTSSMILYSSFFPRGEDIFCSASSLRGEQLQRRQKRQKASVATASTSASSAARSDNLNEPMHAMTLRRKRIRGENAEKSARRFPPVSTKRKVAIFVEPSPFTHVSGMKNRFLRLIENLAELGDEVVVITPCVDPPKEYCGCKVIGVKGIVLPFYGTDTLLLSTGLSGRVLQDFREKKPDLIHCSTPGTMIWAAILYSKMFGAPLVQSYHTHIPHYIPRYTPEAFGIARFLQRRMWDLIRIWSGFAQTTMVTSSIMEEELRQMGCSRLQVWQKGVDTVTFNPKFKNEEFSRRVLTEGRSGPIIGCVGRLGAEKNLYALKEILTHLPEDTNVAIIGDGPERKALEKHFEGTRTTFTGMLTGEDLAMAYAGLDVFVMPSESETLGFVVMEAMASGVPVVAVAAGGLLDIMTNCAGTAGELYPSGDYTKAGELTKNLLTDKEKLARYSQASLEYVSQWSWMSSNKKLRNRQYFKAVRRHWKANFGKERAKKIKVRQWMANALQFVTSGQFLVNMAFIVAAFGIVLAGRNFELSASVAKKVTANSTATNGMIKTAVAAIEAAILKYGVPAAMSTNVFMIALVGIVPFMPTIPLFIASGLFFGVIEGGVLNVVGATIAAVVAANASRAIVNATTTKQPAELMLVKSNAPIRRFLKAQMTAMKNGIVNEDTISQSVSVCGLRLLPHSPFTVVSYVLGAIRDLRMRAVVLGTAVGSIPWAFFYSLVGNSGKSLLQLSSSSSGIAAKKAAAAASKTSSDLAAITSERIVDALSHADKLVPKVLTGTEILIVAVALGLTAATALKLVLDKRAEEHGKGRQHQME
jgi:sulfoquinovosyltransferase